MTKRASSACPARRTAPRTRFSFGRNALRATIVSAILFGIYYLNYVQGWVTPADLDWLHRS